MDSSLEKLLGDFEKFQVEQVLNEVKEWSIDDDEGIREYGEELLEERRKRRQLAQAAQTARHTYVQQHWNPGCYPQLTTEWYISGASTSAAPIGAMSLSGRRHPRQHHHHRPMSCEREGLRRRPPVNYQQNNDDLNDKDYDSNDSDSDDDDEDNDDDGDIMAELAELRAKEERRRAQRRASKARCRARRRKSHLVSLDDDNDDDDVYKEVAKLRAKEARRLAQRRAERARYRVKHANRIAAYQKQYYAMNAERLRAYKRQYNHSKAGQRWQKQYLARKREAAALRGAMVRKRTEEKRQALGPLKLTVTLEDFMQDFHDSLSPNPEDSMDQPETITDMDSGVLHPLDYSVCGESSLSSCDMWDDGKGFLDNLLDDLSSSDDCLFDFLTDMMLQEDPSFDLDDFVT